MSLLLRRRLVATLLNLATVLVVGINLVPIAWMIYCSFKDNNEILSGKVLPGRRDYTVVFLSRHAGDILIGASDGSLTLADTIDLSTVREKRLGTFSTHYLRDGETLWVLSANKGLLELDWKTLSLRHRYSVGDMASAYGPGWKTLWVNDVASSSLARSGDKLYFGYQNANFPGLAYLDLTSRKLGFVRGFSTAENGRLRELQSLRNGNLAVLTDQGLWIGNGTDFHSACGHCATWPETFDHLVAADSLLILDRSGSLYFYHPQQDSAFVYSTPNASGAANAFALPSHFSTLLWQGSDLWAGYAQGAMRIPQSWFSGDTTQPPWVSVPAQSPGYEGNGEVAGMEVTSILPLTRGGFLFGGRKGTLSRESLGRLIHVKTPPSPWYFRWRNYVDLWRNIDFGLYLKNSLIVCGTVMLFAVIFASMGGYALARYEFPGKNSFSMSVLATQMVPGILLLLPIYLMFVQISKVTGFQLKGSYTGLIFTYTAYFVPFSIWILRGFFASLPKELEEAALIDGCGPLRAFFTIIVPSAWPGIIATGITVFLSCWDELMFAWVLTNETTATLPVGIRLFVGNYQNRFDLMMAAATISTLPPMILFFLMQKQIVAGLTAGAVKD